MEEEFLIIFVKNPISGKVKTRLATSIGNRKALKVYEQLLNITLRVTKKVQAFKAVFYSDFIATNDLWDDDSFNKFVQTGKDLGSRMMNAFDQAFALGAKRVVIIGSDCPEISPETLEEAFEALTEKDTVVGPAKDGGYYLIGMKKPHPFLFNKEWSTDTVFEDTLTDLKTNQLSFHLLPQLTDLDTINDLEPYKKQFGL
ncbi:TIGR04282 family arsenosugar biosynthesis glycosyltransferase [Bacteroidota bacterium]